MKIQVLDLYEYESLRTCPFCSGLALSGSSEIDCPHYLTAFQDGFWRGDLCPPVFCDGFLFEREAMVKEMSQSSDVICRKKPGTSGHPQVEAYFCSDVATVKALRKKFKRAEVPGADCAECGNQTAVVDELDEIRCAACGERAFLPEAPDI
jgi:hypothetical protein